MVLLEEYLDEIYGRIEPSDCDSDAIDPIEELFPDIDTRRFKKRNKKHKRRSYRQRRNRQKLNTYRRRKRLQRAQFMRSKLILKLLYRVKTMIGSMEAWNRNYLKSLS